MSNLTGHLRRRRSNISKRRTFLSSYQNNVLTKLDPHIVGELVDPYLASIGTSEKIGADIQKIVKLKLKNTQVR